MWLPASTFNLLDGALARCLTSAGCWESEMIQSWSLEFEFLTVSLLRINCPFQFTLPSRKLCLLVSWHFHIQKLDQNSGFIANNEEFTGPNFSEVLRDSIWQVLCLIVCLTIYCCLECRFVKDTPMQGLGVKLIYSLVWGSFGNQGTGKSFHTKYWYDSYKVVYISSDLAMISNISRYLYGRKFVYILNWREWLQEGAYCFLSVCLFTQSLFKHFPNIIMADITA